MVETYFLSSQVVYIAEVVPEAFRLCNLLNLFDACLFIYDV
jgi:hypothetical protein